MFNKKALAATLTAAALLAGAGSTQAGMFTIHSNFTSFNSAASGLVLQDLESFSAGDNLSGVNIFGGVSVTTNMDALQAFSSGGDITMFGIAGRGNGDARYDIALSLPYFALGFDIESFEADPNEPSKAAGPGVMTINFADATSTAVNIFGNLNGDPIFFGITSDTAITSVRWAEALEGNGGNEETSLDNFYISRIPVGVIEPGSLALVGAGLLGFGAARRRRAD